MLTTPNTFYRTLSMLNYSWLV